MNAPKTRICLALSFAYSLLCVERVDSHVEMDRSANCLGSEPNTVKDEEAKAPHKIVNQEEEPSSGLFCFALVFPC